MAFAFLVDIIQMKTTKCTSSQGYGLVEVRGATRSRFRKRIDNEQDSSSKNQRNASREFMFEILGNEEDPFGFGTTTTSERICFPLKKDQEDPHFSIYDRIV
jgi:hypothetical protein